MVSLDGNYENGINISYFLSFVQVLRDFRVSSPKCAFLTDPRNREEIINGI